jgi:hypothetical protein
MARKHEPLEVVDSSGLTDDDWAKINRLRHLTRAGGPRRYQRRSTSLREADSIKFVHIMSAFFPATMLRARDTTTTTRSTQSLGDALTALTIRVPDRGEAGFSL